MFVFVKQSDFSCLQLQLIKWLLFCVISPKMETNQTRLCFCLTNNSTCSQMLWEQVEHLFTPTFVNTAIASIPSGPPTMLTIIHQLCSMKQKHTKYTNTNESMHGEMHPVRPNPLQRTVRTTHPSVLMTVRTCSTQYNTEQF